IESVRLVGCGSWHGMKAYSRGVASNVFLLDGGSEMALVDVGVPEGVEDILQNVRSLGKDPQRIKKILLTHGHVDHAAGVAEVLKHVDAEVFGHRLTKETLADGPGIYIHEFHPDGHLRGPVHRVIKEGDRFKVGSIDLAVIELPGHTPDGVGYVFELQQGRACFTGDTVIGDQPAHRGVIGWMDGHWHSQLTPFAKSLDRVQALELTAFFGGHGDAHLTAASVRESMKNCIEGLARLRAVPDLDWLFMIER
ncbi:MAG TPA: MBL fold metallo-hydrolase, partial [Planctomycetota bacterium]|nr:MBL fold metallo-hydrolase [Planctomycetota bacterium]